MYPAIEALSGEIQTCMAHNNSRIVTSWGRGGGVFSEIKKVGRGL